MQPLSQDIKELLYMIRNPIDWKYEPVGAMQAASMLISAIQNKYHVTIDADKDPDGYFCGRQVGDILDSFGHTKYSVVRTQEKRHGVDGATWLTVANNDSKLLIVLDSSSDRLAELFELSEQMDIIVIDHHKPTKTVPPNTNTFVYINSLNFSDSGYKSMSAGLATYLTFEPLMQSEMLRRELASLAYASIITDAISMDSHKLISFSETVRRSAVMHPLLSVFANTFSSGLNREFISFQVSPRLNACFRASRIDLVYDLFFQKNYRGYLSRASVTEIEKVYKENRDLTKQIIALAKPQIVDNFVLVELDSPARALNINTLKMRLFTGLVANEFSKRTYKPCISYLHGQQTVKGSVRDYHGRPLLNYFSNFIEAGGHPPAFGFEDLETNFNYLLEKLQMITKKLPQLDKRDLKLPVSKEMFADSKKLIEVLEIYSLINELGPSVPNIFLDVTIPGSTIISNREEVSSATTNGISMTSFSGFLFPNVNYIFKPTNGKLIR